MSARPHSLRPDVIVIGAGLVGLSVAYGLLRAGQSVLVLDEGGRSPRASRGNFGMVWVQGKGHNCHPYAALTLQAAGAWAGFSRKLFELTGVDTAFQGGGCYRYAFDHASLSAFDRVLRDIHRDSDGRFTHEVVEGAELRRRMPWVGSEVVGATFSPHDGVACPLRLIEALSRAILAMGGDIRTGCHVRDITSAPGGAISLSTSTGVISAAKVVMAQGLGAVSLAAKLGITVPLHPEKGQILVTARMAPFLTVPSPGLRQTPEGSVLIGATNEDAGFDLDVTREGLRTIAQRAVALCPAIADVPVVRSWAALRIMTPDGWPVYQHVAELPGLWIIAVHSGVTLAPIHAQLLAQAIIDDRMAEPLTAFPLSRFSRQQAS
jgi:glycine/D-amino acid oxidase-like deaminating enzyme